jgi:hypothetical protein
VVWSWTQLYSGLLYGLGNSHYVAPVLVSPGIREHKWLYPKSFFTTVCRCRILKKQSLRWLYYDGAIYKPEEQGKSIFKTNKLVAV